MLAKEHPSLAPGQPISMPTQAMSGFAPCRLHHLKTIIAKIEVMAMAVSADEDASEAEVSEAEASILEIVREEAEASLAAKFSKSPPFPYKDYSTTIVRRHTYARLTVGSLDTVCRCYTYRRKQP